MTRFSRVTFNAAHKFLGLTTEVLRTEKAINDIACHPLPASFYESGGLTRLRQLFDESPGPDGHDQSSDYFVPPSSSAMSSSGPSSRVLSEGKSRQPSAMRSSSYSRKLVQAGDLLSTIGGLSEVYRPRSFNIFNSPRNTRREFSLTDTDIFSEEPAPVDDFDLKEEVMSCIAKSIGLIQPPLVGNDFIETETSPPFPASDSGISGSSFFKSSLGSLSLLDMVDDAASSMTGSSTTTEYMSGLHNEVEIRFFPCGSTLASAGERNTGSII
jgi:lysophospholipid hydrolase